MRIKCYRIRFLNLENKMIRNSIGKLHLLESRELVKCARIIKPILLNCSLNSCNRLNNYILNAYYVTATIFRL